MGGFNAPPPPPISVVLCNHPKDVHVLLVLSEVALFPNVLSPFFLDFLRPPFLTYWKGFYFKKRSKSGLLVQHLPFLDMEYREHVSVQRLILR